jgi:hypothetical protein
MPSTPENGRGKEDRLKIENCKFGIAGEESHSAAKQ